MAQAEDHDYIVFDLRLSKPDPEWDCTGANPLSRLHVGSLN